MKETTNDITYLITYVNKACILKRLTLEMILLKIQFKIYSTIEIYWLKKNLYQHSKILTVQCVFFLFYYV